jgi:hypothetical protein
MIRRIGGSPSRRCSGGATWATWTIVRSPFARSHARTLMLVLDEKSRIPTVFIDHHALRFPPSILLLLVSTRDTRRLSRTTASQRPHASRTNTSACWSTTSSRAPWTSADSSGSPRRRAPCRLQRGWGRRGRTVQQARRPAREARYRQSSSPTSARPCLLRAFPPDPKLCNVPLLAVISVLDGVTIKRLLSGCETLGHLYPAPPRMLASRYSAGRLSASAGARIYADARGRGRIRGVRRAYGGL